ncbi:MAG: thiamine-phosphate kinase [Nitrospirae bacterium]|nr:thiamine-phosphate kinase [Nitrospirota bacterium]
MDIEQLGEAGLIQRIKRKIPANDPSIVLGIGDDAAIIDPSGRDLLLSTDTIREGIHFSMKYYSFFDIGWKAVAVSISDIAAMGGVPKYLLLSMAMPDKVPVKNIDRLLDGVAEISNIYNVSIIGGNLSRSMQGVVVDTTIVGEVSGGKALLRSGARIGDLIYVTGFPGMSAMGLSILKSRVGGQSGRAFNSVQKPVKPGAKTFINSHLRPVPRVSAGLVISKSKSSTAAIDISDGLLADLAHICDRSKVGARIFCNLLPLPAVPGNISKFLASKPLFYALYGGEDYELLFTVRSDDRTKFESLCRRQDVKCTMIGQITHAEEGLRLINEDNKESIIEPYGYDHFKSGRRRLC